ncbi:unnamed protein product [Cuscuta campestris]|uniref:Cation efflux protein cytoplasmic domain-containing protein n=1 Tax=Cuscuta campestris TaxID=132261 RepID=A0A484NQX4_9ASTE|nr:unnamed protein product [Cuscuta campestris]
MEEIHHEDVQEMRNNELPQAHHLLPCNSICSFSNAERHLAESSNRTHSAKKLWVILILSVLAMVVEIIGGILANSLAVFTDASHLLVDTFGFSISLYSLRVSGRVTTPEHSFGFQRGEVLGSLLNVVLIWGVSLVLIYRAVERIFQKNVEVNGPLMFATAAFGFLINLVSVWVLGHHHHHDHDHHHHRRTHNLDDEHNQELQVLNQDESRSMPRPSTSSSARERETTNMSVDAAYVHTICDLIQSIGVMIAGGIMWWKPKWFLVDLACTLIFSVISLYTTIKIGREAVWILMEKVPREVDIAILKNGLKDIRGVHDVHDLHVWAITTGRIVLACHVAVEPGVDPSDVLGRVREFCLTTFNIHHITVQIEHLPH